MMKFKPGAIILLMVAILFTACIPAGTVQTPAGTGAPAGSPPESTPPPGETSPEPAPAGTPTASVDEKPPPTSPETAVGTGGTLVEWQRSGGIAGGCRQLILYPDGRYEYFDCQEQSLLSAGQLPPEELAYLNDLAARYGVFRWEFKPPKNAADMFLDGYNFHGSGGETPSEQVMQEINNRLARLSGTLASQLK
jgi:hypothetical protein